MSTSPLLFKIKENTHLKGFAYASIVVGLASAFTLEYRFKDPFHIYQVQARNELDKDTTTWNVIMTSIIACLSTFVILWTLKLSFGLGDAWVQD